MKNLGVKSGSRPTDYVGGTLPYEIRNPSGDWRPYLPIGEIQFGREDWMDCTVRSLTNTIEIQHKFLTGTEINLNDREISIGAGVTREGAYMWQGVDYVRKTGAALQDIWPDSGGTWDVQYTSPPTDIRMKLDASKADWLTKWDVKYEQIEVSKKSFLYHLKHSPLHVTIKNPGHAIVDVRCEADVERIFDSYPPFSVDIPGKYAGPIVFAQKVVLYKREQAISDEALLVDIKYLDGGKQVEKLKNALHKIGWMPDMSQYRGYDQRLANLVLNFQKANFSHTSWAYFWAIWYYRGRLVDQATRDVINQLLNNIHG